MFNKFMSALERAAAWPELDWVLWGAIGVAVLVFLMGIIMTAGSVVARTKRRLRAYNKVISSKGLRSREHFYNLDVVIKRKKTAITNAWMVAYPDNVCAFMQALGYTGSIAQVTRTRTRRNYIFTLSVVFAFYAALCIFYSIVNAGYLYFALPMLVLLWAHIIEAKCECADERNRKKMVAAYNEFVGAVALGINEVYGIKVCQCQCVADNFDESKVKGESNFRALLARQDEEHQKAERERQIQEKNERKQAEKNKQLLKQEKEKTKELKERNERLVLEQARLEELHKVRIENENLIEKERMRAEQEEEERKQRFEEERKQLAVLAKQRDDLNKVQKIKSMNLKSGGGALSTRAGRKGDAKRQDVVVVSQDVAQSQSRYSDASNQVVESSSSVTRSEEVRGESSTSQTMSETRTESKSFESFSKRELKAEKENLRAQYDSLQVKLAQIRKANAKQEKKQNRDIERKGIGYYSDAESFEKTGADVTVSSKKQTGKYDEEEVKTALADLMGAMNTLQKQIDTNDGE